MGTFIYDRKRAKFIVGQGSDCITSPLLINWNIIGDCCNSCAYCYGYDIRSHKTALREKELEEMLCHLESIHPLVLVITGGEPLLCDGIFYIVERISKFANVILDTNGLLLDEKTVKRLKESKLHLRISLDSDLSYINEKVRKSGVKNSTEKIKSAIKTCTLEGMDLTVQTVVSSVNIEHLGSLFTFLKETGVKNWRLLDVVTNPNCSNLSLTKKQERLLQEKVSEFINQAPDMFITYVNEKNTKDNNVILINPKGEYLYRPAGCAQKQFICKNDPKKPSLDQIMERLDVKAHIRRYVI